MRVLTPLWVLVEMRRELRRHQLAACTLAGLAALGGAISLYVAIDQWLLGNGFWSAVNTAVAFYNSLSFERTMQHLYVLGRVQAKLNAQIEIERERAHG
jgi:hypothetical protein